MLVLTRRPGEEIIINENIRVTIVSIKGDRIRLGITAPATVAVDRAEVHDRRTSFIDLSVPSRTSDPYDTSLNSQTKAMLPVPAQLAG